MAGSALNVEASLSEEPPKHRHNIDPVVAQEVLESHVSFNVGRMLNIWYSLVKALSSFHRPHTSDSEIGLTILGKIHDEIRGAREQTTPNDDIVRYVILNLSSNNAEMESLNRQIELLQKVLGKINKHESTSRTELLEGERILLRILDQLKPIARRHQDKFTALLLGTELTRE